MSEAIVIALENLETIVVSAGIGTITGVLIGFLIIVVFSGDSHNGY